MMRLQVPATRNDLILVTDTDLTRDFVPYMFRLLPSAAEGRRVAVERFIGLQIRNCSSEHAALETLEERLDASAPEPALVIVDALVRKRSRGGPGNGEAATTLLQWLEEHYPSVPVIVASSASLERLDLKVLSRQNVALWSMDPQQTEDAGKRFVDLLAGFSSLYGARSRRITVVVKKNSAQYRIKEGLAEFTTDEKPYADADDLACLIDLSRNFTPYGQTTVRDTWQLELGKHGKDLFKLLFRDTLGPRFIETMSTANGAPPAAGRLAVDLRFDIDMDLDRPDIDGLFTLPFEALNHDRQPESFLCTRVPMARRLGVRPPDGGAAGTPASLEPARVLFVSANIDGSNVPVVDETTGQRFYPPISPLYKIDEEIEILTSLFAENNRLVRKLAEPVVVNQDTARGRLLKEHIKQQLIEGRYDILHFAGHSVTDASGGTFLVLPGPDDGDAIGVSVREVAHWVCLGGCKLVVLSACRAASRLTAIEMMKAGAQAVLGFRWDADAEFAAPYFRLFYRAYFREGQSLSSAYRDACHQARLEARGSPLWASAIAVVRD